MAKKDKIYSEEIIKAKRRFPKAKTVIIFVLLAIQIALIILACLYTPTPQDRIELYELTVMPRSDGAVDITYRFVWTPLDTSEELTWIDIGMANENFGFYESSLSDTIDGCEKYVDGDYVSARIYLDKPYKAGETLEFSFRIRQQDLLCKNDEGYFYELVPGWFNATPVEKYRFTWQESQNILSSNATAEENDTLVWEGGMPCGTYVKLRVDYDTNAFSGVNTVKYSPFYDGEVYNELQSDKAAIIVLAVSVCIILLICQVYMIDSIVSYHRGRGFLTGYGYHVHTYGYSNPRYIRARDEHTSTSGSRGGRSGGCACACACACAGGGRAGCSQKDTKELRRKNK